MKDVIIENWFKENANLNSELALGDVSKVINSIAEYYSQHSLIVSKEMVMNHFNSMNLLNLCIFMDDYTTEVSYDEDFDDTEDTDDELAVKSENVAEDAKQKDSVRKVHSYNELTHIKKTKTFTTKGIHRDHSVLKPEDYFDCTENVPSDPKNFIVAHIPGDAVYKAVWFKNEDIPDMKDDSTINRRLRNSFVKHYADKGYNLFKISSSNVSICNGDRYVKRYLNVKG